jgi:hypothetical protein
LEDSLAIDDSDLLDREEIGEDSLEEGDLDPDLAKGEIESGVDQNKKSDTPADEYKAVTIGKLKSGHMYKVKVELQGKIASAIVDTAAEATLISEELYQSLENPPPITSETVMNTAGKGMQMNGFIVGPVSIRVRSQTFTTNVYVASIFDDMLLGFDLLKGNGIDICMSQGHMDIKGEKVPMFTGSVNEGSQISNVSVTNRTVVPPNLVVRMEGRLDQKVNNQYIIEPGTWKDLLIL